VTKAGQKKVLERIRFKMVRADLQYRSRKENAGKKQNDLYEPPSKKKKQTSSLRTGENQRGSSRNVTIWKEAKHCQWNLTKRLNPEKKKLTQI